KAAPSPPAARRARSRSCSGVRSASMSKVQSTEYGVRSPRVRTPHSVLCTSDPAANAAGSPLLGLGQQIVHQVDLHAHLLLAGSDRHLLVAGGQLVLVGEGARQVEGVLADRDDAADAGAGGGGVEVRLLASVGSGLDARLVEQLVGVGTAEADAHVAV